MKRRLQMVMKPDPHASANIRNLNSNMSENSSGEQKQNFNRAFGNVPNSPMGAWGKDQSMNQDAASENLVIYGGCMGLMTVAMLYAVCFKRRR